MLVPFLLLLFSLAGIAAALSIPHLSDLLLIAGPAALASLYLLLRALITGGGPGKVRANYIVIDGSNVMHWADSTPKIETVREVVNHLIQLGFAPGVVFDANAGYLVAGTYLHHQDFARMLGLPTDQVLVVHKGEPADIAILQAAAGMSARVVTNDRYRDWADQHPEVLEPGHLVRGGYRKGRLWLDLDEAPQANAAPHPATR